jgi:hypothetical protein
VGIELPPGLAASEPYIPDVGFVYWLEQTLLDPTDPEERRPGVVIAVPDTVNGTVIVVTRSSTDGFGVAHDEQREIGLNKPAHFSRLLPVQCQLWTPELVHEAGPLDPATFAWVQLRFER